MSPSVSQSAATRDPIAPAAPEAEPSAAFPHEDIVAELSFVIGERLATIFRIKRERKESERIKAIRIAVCEKMIGRTRAARAMVEAYPDLLALAYAIRDASELAGITTQGPLSTMARAAITKATGAA